MMADTRRTVTALQALLANNVVGAISPQDMRDVLVSCAPPYGSIYETAIVTTAIVTQGVFVKAAGTTASRHLKEFSMPIDNRLQYDGAPDVHVHVVATVSFEAASNNQEVAVRIAKNGDAADADSIASQVEHKVGTAGDKVSTAVHFDTIMSQGDYLEVWLANGTSTADITMDDLYFFAMGMLT